jgi:alpha-L-fucosidase
MESTNSHIASESMNTMRTSVYGMVWAMLLTTPAFGQQTPPGATTTADKQYEPNWKSLDSRPNPAWFDEDKIGIFIHWSVFSVPAVAWVYPDKDYLYGGLSCLYERYIDRIHLLAPAEQAKLEAFHRKNYGNASFRELAPLFKAEAFDPRQWAELFKRSGARYAFLTSNFEDGYCLWPSPYSPGWNSADVGPKRDLLGDFCKAVRGAGLRAGFYYSLGEINHPLYPWPSKERKPDGDLKRFIREHMQPQLREVVSRYKPSIIYFDRDWDFPLDDYEMQGFLAWLFNDSPCKNEVMVNDRFGIGSRGKHGGVYCSEAGNREGGTERKWCEDRPISRGNWSYNRLEKLEDYLGERDMIQLLVETVAQGGNMHFDVSPCADGTIPMLQQERLVQMGQWLKVNGDAIYGTRRWRVTHEGPLVPTYDPRLDPRPGTDGVWMVRDKIPQVQYTRKGDVLYAISLAWPGKTLKLENPTPGPETRVEMLGVGPVSWKAAEKGMTIEIPALSVAELPCRHAWVFKLTGLQNVE